jgi:ABC-type transporter Mla MlaB component
MGDNKRIVLPQALTIPHLATLHQTLLSNCTSNAITFDAVSVEEIDFSGIQFLVVVKKILEKSNKKVHIINTPNGILQSLSQLGIKT